MRSLYSRPLSSLNCTSGTLRVVRRCGNFVPHKPPRTFERNHAVLLLFRRAHHAHKDARILEVPANLHPRHSHKPQPRVFQLALDQVRDDMLYFFRNLYMPCIHDFNSILNRECWICRIQHLTMLRIYLTAICSFL